MPPAPSFNTIGVIVGRDLVGDALIKLPFLRALRGAFPKARIHWITSQGPTAYGGPLRDATKDLIDEINEQPGWLPLADPPKVTAGTAPFFDLLIDTRNRWKEARMARQVPHGLFIAPAMRFLFSEKRPSLFQPKPPHLCDQLLNLVELAAGWRPPSTGSLHLPDSLKAQARKLLPPGQVYVGVAPGAGNPVKIWPRFKFEKLAMAQAAKGRVPVFILGPQELSWYDELIVSVPIAKFPLQDYAGWGNDRLTIDETLAIASCLDAAVANDSGVGHMLAAMDCPLVSLFGPTSPDKLAPRVSRGIVLRAQDFGPDLGSAHMSAIPWEAADQAVDQILAHSTAKAGVAVQ
jgi:ADP-heptose:LPS heptosyltransferase